MPQGTDRDGRPFYKVARYYGSERPVEFILTWGDITNGIAYPLSMAIVDEVRRHDRSMRGFDARDSDDLNAELVAKRLKDSRDEGREIARWFQSKLDGNISVLFRSKNLKQARDRVRGRTKESKLKP
ncbi:MAG: hypothetical protein H0V71_03715 [Chloroflexi bacterium]|nr:hypothetical protein [Chloroflexota bacterium]